MTTTERTTIMTIKGDADMSNIVEVPLDKLDDWYGDCYASTRTMHLTVEGCTRSNPTWKVFYYGPDYDPTAHPSGPSEGNKASLSGCVTVIDDRPDLRVRIPVISVKEGDVLRIGAGLFRVRVERRWPYLDRVDA